MKRCKSTNWRSWIRENSAELLKFCNFSYGSWIRENSGGFLKFGNFSYCLWNRRRSGASAIEMFVALALITSVLTLSAPLVVRHGRMLIAHRHYRIALDELTNQLEILSALPAADVPMAVEQIAPSSFATARLPGLELSAQLVDADIGQRVTLSITWGEPERRRAPVSLVAWIIAEPSRADDEPPGEEAP
jgi:hypothetical protein